MAKPRLVKVRALFYVLQHITKRGYAYFDTASYALYLFLPEGWSEEEQDRVEFKSPDQHYEA